MTSKDNIEEIGSSFFYDLIKKIKPAYLLLAALPLVVVYPKPLMLILKPIIRNWSFHYRSINSVRNKPCEIILTSNPNLSFTKQHLRNFRVIKGVLP